MENISLKLEKTFLREIEKLMKKHNYMTKTEFIREAIRDKIKKLGEKQKETTGHVPSHIPHAQTGEKSERKELPSYI